MDSAELERLLSDPMRRAEVRARLRDLLDASPKTTTYMLWLGRLPAGTQAQHVAVLSSFSIQVLDPFLSVEAFLGGFEPSFSYVEYGLWQNALLSGPDEDPERGPVRAVVLLLHDMELLSEAQPDAQAASAHLIGLLRSFRQRSTVPVFVGIVASPPGPPSIALGGPTADVLGAARRAFRQAVAEAIGEIAECHGLELPADLVSSATGFDPAAYLAQRSALGPRALPGVARTVARALACLFRPRRKLLVLDLDNTLWGGVVGEDGLDALAIGHEYPGSAYRQFQQQLLALRASGVLLALASKNNEADARAVFESRPEMVLRWEHFSAHAVNWSDKASNIRAMAARLGLGLDSVVFADDSAIECALVRQALPEVEVVELGASPAQHARLLFRSQAFDALHVTSEDRQRADGYAAEANRETMLAQSGDMRSFLQGCLLHLVIQPVDEGNIQRAHQLLSKTNQFNFSLQRPGLDQLTEIARAGDGLFVASLDDRFGHYGLIGILQLAPQERSMRIVNMALSCRALGRGVQEALLAFARERAEQLGLGALRLRCVRGPRNQQVFEFVEQVGFRRARETPEAVDYDLEPSAGWLPWPDYIKVEQTGVPAGA